MTTAETKPEFAIQRLYVKDQSFEAPGTPGIFQKQWNPELNLQIQSRHNKISDDLYEVILQITATAQSNKETAFIAEVHQAGIFTIKDFPAQDIHRLIGQICPNILYPYLRAVISQMVADASFPSLYLAPVNFEALYEQQLAQAKGEGAPA